MDDRRAASHFLSKASPTCRLAWETSGITAVSQDIGAYRLVSRRITARPESLHGPLTTFSGPAFPTRSSNRTCRPSRLGGFVLAKYSARRILFGLTNKN